VDEALVAPLLDEYEALYHVAPELQKGGARRESLRRAARQELGMRAFLKEKQLGAFTTTFEDLYGMDQLPGLACQRLMAEGYGFGAEGDWKTAAMVRVMKVMGRGLAGGASLMEDYTYHLAKGEERILGSHMLEICPSIAEHKPTLEVHPLGIGGKADPCRLVFAAGPGAGVNATLVDMGGRMRLVVNDLDVVRPSAPTPKLPVACAVWIPKPDFKRGCEAWILAGGAHHSAFTQALTAEHLETFASMVGIEMIHINAETRIPALKKELRWNDAAYKLGI
jgi:L-arabinose isomerase